MTHYYDGDEDIDARADYEAELAQQAEHDARTALVEKYEMDAAEVAAMSDLEVFAELDEWRQVDAQIAAERWAERCLTPGYGSA